MPRRFYVAIALAAASSIQAAENATERICTRGMQPQISRQRPEIAELFAQTDRQAQIIETETGVSAPLGPMEVLVARVGPDGKVIIGCVDNEAAALRFLTAPVETLSARTQEK